KQAIANKPFTIQGDGKQTRSFCYIDDTIRGILQLMKTAGVNVPVNIGNPNEITVMQLALTIKKMIGSSNGFEYRQLPDGDPKRRMPDITRAKELLGWEPTIDLERGLSKTIDFFSKAC
ncbi:MAG: GDP-mannose 4,6-dehydratase, partial [Thermoguttaceae bacterium]|nr:GDP-mannose 4,6-dehydratase [Thermoguttaceae bacterium]